ncbi:25130_t:CDS:2 [Cetraspora pellucida]|uniref:25130_t:CDS:1 n=1 Tax=Cetraspora pellucida TaxID=1433469 RepID=A0A9N9ABX9_9GLOM|nr:25130_t:CDS:2 [Cetraspora pellucida]
MVDESGESELEAIMFILYEERKQEIDYLIKETERRIELENVLKSKRTDELIALKNRIIKSERDVVELKAEKGQVDEELNALKETNKELWRQLKKSENTNFAL